MAKNQQAPESHAFAHSNIIRLLKIFSKEEIKELGKFVHSPFHNNRSEVSRFFDEISKYYPSFTGESFSKESIYKALYPKTVYRDDVIRRHSSNLFKLCEEFASFQSYKKDNFNYEKSLLDFYASKNEDKFFWKQHTKIEAYMEEQKLRNPEYFYRLRTINSIERSYMLKEDPTYRKSGFQKEIENLWKYFISAVLKAYGFARFEMKFFNKEYRLEYADEILNIAEKSGFMNSKSAEIYYLLLRLNTDARDDATFYKAIRIMERHIEIFDNNESFAIYAGLLSYSSDRKVEPGKDYTRIEFEIVKKMVEYGLLINTGGGATDPGWFLGVFFRACNAGEIEFAEKFVEEYKPKVAGKDKENVIRHAYANLAIEKKNYEEALEYLSTASYKTSNDKLGVNYMYLKIYYETDRYEEFFYRADRFKHIIKDTTTNREVLATINNFVKIFIKIFKYKLGESHSTLDELKHQILKQRIISRKYLLGKIHELEKAE